MKEQEIFLNALRHESEEARRAYLESCCGSDRRLLLRVKALLKAHANTGGFLANPAAGLPTVDMPPIAEGPGSTVGVYRLLQLIGEGGFGVVYMAEQTEPVRRKVALKIIKPGMDTKEVIARFESERQALALMDHPNIARVLDAGATASGRPYFVMELVKGVPITEFCDKNHLSVAKRMALFLPVCLAIQHAHHKGIIHRDIKPSNVMVTLHDGDPVPKVIDFGVAKATSQQLTMRTLFTAFGQMIGTPLYMSPEQAEMSGLDIDTRSDIYSLGVLLYELLTGTTPIEQKKLREAGLVEMQRLIREVEAPRPSTRLSTLNEEATVQISSDRGTDRKRLSDLLRGDVDWIVMKALEKDRQRRYDTPTAFADDIRRFLNDEAIHARPPSTVYRLRKFIRRNKRLAASIGAVAATLLVGVIVSSGLAIYADLLRRDAEMSRRAEARARQEAVTRGKESERRREEAVTLNAQLTKSNEQQRREIYASDMNLIRIEAQRGNLQRMREILMEQLPIHGEEDLRGFEWNYWYKYLTHAQVLMKLENFKYNQAGSASAIVPGGKLVAVTEGNQTQIREIASGRILGTLPYQIRVLVNRTRFSATGRSVIGDCNTGIAYLSVPRVLGTDCTVFGPTGEKYTFNYPPGSFSHISFLNISPDGRYIVVLGIDKSHTRDKPACRLLVWDVDSKEVVLNQVQQRELNRVEFSPDGSLLAAHVCHGTKKFSNEFRDVVVVIDIATGEERGVAQHNDDIDCLYWLPDQERLLLVTLGFGGSDRKELLSWSLDEQRARRLSQETMPHYPKGAVSPDGRFVSVAGHATSSIRLIDTERGNVVNTFHNEATTIDTLTFSGDGQRIIACSTTGEVLGWDLGRQSDLFALQLKPLRQLVSRGYALSKDQSLLAVVHSDKAIIVRTREGNETVLKLGNPAAESGSSNLLFSDDNRYLAHRTYILRDRNTLTGARSGDLLELFDLQSGRRLWQIVHPQISINRPMEFSSDQQYLILLTSKGSLVVMTCATGEAETRLPESTNERFRAAGLVRSAATGRLLVGGAVLGATSSELSPVTTEVVLKDALTGKSLYGSKLSILMDGRKDSRSLPAQVFPSPDGMHIGVVSQNRSNVEIWNLQDEKLVIAARGSTIEFSPNGTRVWIARFDQVYNAAAVSYVGRISHLSLWDIPSGQQLCEISLAGDHADLVRFSPDGRRLLTLHGHEWDGAGGSTAQGRLWEVESGREILAMPVAEQNVYVWDLLFDSTGQRLTSLLLGKSSGTGGGGNSVVYDAAPLRAEDDARLIAGRLVDLLSKETPLPNEMRAEIDARKGLKPQVRETALAAVERIGLDVNRVANACLEIVFQQFNTQERFQNALRFASVLHQAEPKALRSRVLLGAAQFRCGLVREATATLADPATGLTEKSSDYEQLRLYLLLMLAKRQANGNVEELQKLLTAIATENVFTNIYPTNRDISNVRMEAQLTYSLSSYIYYVAPLTDESIAVRFKANDFDGNGKLTENEGIYFATHKSFDRNRDGSLDLAEYGMAEQVLRLTSLSNPENQKSPASRLANLNKATGLAPEYSGAYNLRARLLATSPDDTIRNGPQAVADATRACELTEWKNASYLDTLAAAYAETENFDEAVKRQEQAMSMEFGSYYTDYQMRLALYKVKKKYRENLTLSTASASAVLPVAGNYSAPLLAADQVLQVRRITGRDSAWSPDGKKLVRNVKSSSSDNLDLEIIDLDSGATTKLSQEGSDPAWSQLTGGSIAFTKVPAGQAGNLGQDEIWLVEPDGSNLRKLASGGLPSWSSDGRLFFQTVTEDKNFLLSAVSPDMPDKPLLNIQLGTAGYAALSRDGTMVVRVAPGELTIERLQPPAVLVTLPLAPKDMGSADWSPDGRFVVYASGDATSPGLWLIEVSTGRKRLLTDLNLARPRWSPDGKLIAVNDQVKSDILLLDISGLDLSKGLQITPVPIKFGEPAPESSAAQTGKDKP